MSTLCKADYYYGALLSVLINNGLAPALIEKETNNRQIYSLTTNNNAYIIYTKFNTSPTGTDDYTWSFNFSENEINEIKKLKNSQAELIFCFICSQKELSETNSQEIAIVYWNEFNQCIDINLKEHKGTPRLSIKRIKNSKGLRIYGSRRSDVLNNKDNTIKIERNRLNNL